MSEKPRTGRVQFVHHAATPGLLLELDGDTITQAKVYGSFDAAVYVRRVGMPGFQMIPVYSAGDYLAFHDLLTTDPEVAAHTTVLSADSAELAVVRSPDHPAGTAAE